MGCDEKPPWVVFYCDNSWLQSVHIVLPPWVSMTWFTHFHLEWFLWSEGVKTLEVTRLNNPNRMCESKDKNQLRWWFCWLQSHFTSSSWTTRDSFVNKLAPPLLLLLGNRGAGTGEPKRLRAVWSHRVPGVIIKLQDKKTQHVCPTSFCSMFFSSLVPEKHQWTLSTVCDNVASLVL